MIKNEVVNEVVSRTNIEQLIGSYVSLKRAGSNYVGLCPFHSEKSPSFTVYPQDNSFYCFGCGVGGNPITFVRRMENLEFEDAVESLAKRVGMTIRRESAPNEGPKIDRQRFFDMNQEAARFFHQSLFEENPEAKAALAYFVEKRKLSTATIRHFGLGFAPNSFSRLYEHLKSKGYTNEEMRLGFLVSRNDRNGTYFDSFRNRVMFPIIDVTGNIIAFGGRVMDDSVPKYKNSSDTPVFKKSRNLFALNFARKTCAEKIVLCEGYMDVIALHAAGITNAVATLGTALTPEQARMLSRYTKKVYLSYDSDEAGQKAIQRAIGIFEEIGMEVSVIKMNGAKDPDEFIKKFGAQSFENLLKESRSKFDFNVESVFAKYDISTPQGKIDACSELCQVIAGFSSKTEREVYINELSKRLSLSQDTISADVNRIVNKKQKELLQKFNQNVHSEIMGYGDKVNPDYAKAPGLAKSEETILGLLLLYPDIRKKNLLEHSLSEEDFYTAFGKRVYTFICEAEKNDGVDNTPLDAFFTIEEVGRIIQMKRARLSLSNNDVNVFLEAVGKLKKEVSNKKMSEKGISMEDLQNYISNLQENNK